MTLPDDPLSQLLTLAGAQAGVSTGLRARGHWAIRVAPQPMLKCNVMRQGECGLAVGDQHWHLKAGDCFLVAPGLGFVIGTDLDRLPRPAEEVFANCKDSLTATLDAGPGPEMLCLGGRMDLQPMAALLIRSLPAVLVIPANHATAGRIGWLLDRLEDESRARAPGAAAMAAQIMQMVFLELIRSLPVAVADGTGQSWLTALSDPRIGPAIQAIHADPGRRWRLEDIAAISHLSRSQFAARFRAAVGQAPMDYLLHWRMLLARQALLRGDSVARVAAEMGYASESAFGVAFRRVTGTTPRHEARSRSETRRPPNEISQ